MKIHISEWTDVERFIEWDLEKYSLQVKTDSEAGSGDYLTIMFYAADEEDFYEYDSLGYVVIEFDDPITFYVDYCTDDVYEFDFAGAELPTESAKIWTFRKSSTDLTIDCNGVRVLNLNFASASISSQESCHEQWSQDVAKMYFWMIDDGEQDTASDAYRKLEVTGQSTNQSFKNGLKANFMTKLNTSDAISLARSRNNVSPSLCVAHDDHPKNIHQIQNLFNSQNLSL